MLIQVNLEKLNMKGNKAGFQSLLTGNASGELCSRRLENTS